MFSVVLQCYWILVHIWSIVEQPKAIGCTGDTPVEVTQDTWQGQLHLIVIDRYRVVYEVAYGCKGSIPLTDDALLLCLRLCKLLL